MVDGARIAIQMTGKGIRVRGNGTKTRREEMKAEELVYYENDLSAEKKAKEERARIPQEDEDKQWPQCPQAEKGQGQETPVGIGTGTQLYGAQAGRPQVQARFRQDIQDRPVEKG